jgi:short-subunit dehydrogenase
MNVFITGGTSGIGLALANHYFKQGHRVAVSSFEAPEKVKGLIHDEFIYYQADVTDQARMREVIYDFKNKAGEISLVFANAGISMDKKKLPDFDRGNLIFQVNVIGVLNTLSPAIEIMKEQGRGHIVGIGSISGLNGLPGMAIYGASKAAIINLFESFSIDLASFGIKTTCLVPGFIYTPLTKDNKHKMPFLLSTEQAVEQITGAVRKNKRLHVFPLPLKIVAIILRTLPRPLYRLIMKFDLLGLAKES